MLNIAVCDDTPAELMAISAMVREYFSQRDIAVNLREFSHPDALMTACGELPFHIFLLDIVMPMISGLELGRSIRRFSTEAQIIYITTERDFALDAYSVNPLHYLLKPVDKQALFSALELAIQKTGKGDEPLLTVKSHSGLRTFSADSLVCCEYRHHAALYTLSTGEQIETLTLPGSFSEHIAPLLCNRRFIRPHAAFIVNMSFVERLDKTGFALRGGAFVPVSGKQFAAVRNAYMSYRLGEE